MAKAEQIKALINSYLKKDDEQFVTVALQVAANEAKKGHGALANEIRSLIDQRNRSPVSVVSISGDLADLVQEVSPSADVTSLVVSEGLRSRIQRVVKEYFQSDKLAKHGMENRRKVLLSGPPGTGKTLTAAVLAHQTGLPLYVIQVDRLITKYLGETGAKLRQIFALIRKSPGVYLFDEFDAIGAQRGLESDVGEMRRILSALLQFIEADDSRSILVAATNNIDALDVALFRRFDDILRYAKPDKTEIEALIKNRLGVFSGKFKMNPVVNAAHGLSHAEVTQACDDSIKETILTDRPSVTQKLLLQMLAERKSVYST
ncbi:AAA family ATPase [Octadecabacter sp. G9-8]|uniref:AAA family ATPase n=1 Tax=Octadecabacter dasysiphoniae TaxID=2909341 RepID=A0ABS9CTE4_9RHOB|nr:AAA family ATPase [Octadecabacter dasysiphoniae]MCF2870503.1 AAA family ATPase [Octadecabacter dasysiphoniae]